MKKGKGKLLLIRRVDVALLNAFCFLMSLFRLPLYWKTSALRKRNAAEKAKPKSSVCNILALGKSLSGYSFADGQDTIVVNNFQKYIDEKGLSFSPKHWILFDNAFYSDGSKDDLSVLVDRFPDTHFLLNGKYYKKFSSLADRNVSAVCGWGKFIEKKKIPNFEKNTPAAVNVSVIAIEYAMYLGYREIRLYGVDMNQFVMPSTPHAYKDSPSFQHTPITDDLFFYSFVLLAHDYLADIAEKKGVKIINMSASSLLESYPKH